MVGGRVVFCEIICLIVFSFLPVELEMLLGFLVLQPIVSHVDSFGSALLHLFVNETHGCGVVQRDWCG